MYLKYMFIQYYKLIIRQGEKVMKVMKLTNFCDYSLRVLIFLGLKNEMSSVTEGKYSLADIIRGKTNLAQLIMHH